MTDIPPRWPWIAFISLAVAHAVFGLIFIGLAVHDWFAIGEPSPALSALVPFVFAECVASMGISLCLIPGAAEYRCEVVRRKKQQEVALCPQITTLTPDQELTELARQASSPALCRFGEYEAFVMRSVASRYVALQADRDQQAGEVATLAGEVCRLNGVIANLQSEYEALNEELMHLRD